MTAHDWMHFLHIHNFIPTYAKADFRITSWVKFATYEEMRILPIKKCKNHLLRMLY